MPYDAAPEKVASVFAFRRRMLARENGAVLDERAILDRLPIEFVGLAATAAFGTQVLLQGVVDLLIHFVELIFDLLIARVILEIVRQLLPLVFKLITSVGRLCEVLFESVLEPAGLGCAGPGNGYAPAMSVTR